MSAQDGFSYSNITATTAGVLLMGGTYLFEVVAASFGTVTLQRLGPDGSTWLSVSTAVAANGGQILHLAPGTYRVALSTAAAVYVGVSRFLDS